MKLTKIPIIVGAILVGYSCNNSSSTEPDKQVAALTIVSGNNQNGVVGTAIGSPLVVQVTNASGAPVAGATVVWIANGDGVPTVGSVLSGADGRSSAGWILGSTAGTQTMTVSTTHLTATFSATAAAGPATGGSLTGDAQSATRGSVLPSPLIVTVRDRFNNPVANASVVWAVASGGGRLSATTTPTNASGQASVTWTLGTSAGEQTVTATVTGLPTLTFRATAT